MTAIFGIYYFDGRAAPAQLLEEMSQILAHRGNDGDAIWYDGSVGFGHRMLWTTPESLCEQLPMQSRSADLVITADARIDNRDQLLGHIDPRLKASDDSISDSEIILLAYQKWGEGCTDWLIGDFAFAIWDKRNRSVFSS